MMSKELSHIYSPLMKYIPLAAHSYILSLIKEHPVRLKVTAPRKTLLGSYRRNRKGQDEISLNGDLNPYSFLITLLHEFAHLKAFKEHGFQIAPHGKEWQITFSGLLAPLIEKKCFPEDIATHLTKKTNRLSASQCPDPVLYSLIKKYDQKTEGVKLLQELCVGDQFKLSNGLKFEKIKINRTRAVCKKIGSKPDQLFTISLLAEVYPI